MRTIAIIGSNGATRDLVNAEPDSTEIWGQNSSHGWLERPATRWFQVHPRDWHGDKAGTYGRGLPHLEFLRSFKGTVYTLFPDERIPNAVRYPFDEVVASMPKARKYLCSTFGYSVAMAIYEKVDVLKVFGCDLITTPEFVHERPNMEYLLGLAEGRGIDVHIPEKSLLLKGPLYPYLDDDRIAAIARVKDQKTTYMKYWMAFATAYGHLAEAEKAKDAGRVEQIELTLSRITARVHEAAGGYNEAGRRLQELGIGDTVAAELPRLVKPVDLIDKEVIPSAISQQVPA